MQSSLVARNMFHAKDQLTQEPSFKAANQVLAQFQPLSGLSG
jgi:hypothetical protein